MLSLINIERVLFRKSFLDFIKHAWKHIEGAGEYVHGRHVEVMASHLQAFGHKQIRKLLLNIPPGCSKSNVFMVCYPAWKWTWEQDAGFLCQSYGMKLALRDATACRRLVESEWYQDRWPEVKLEDDDNAKAYYRTTRGGFRLSTTANVSVTGQHPTDVLCDDPISVDDGDSKAACDDWVNWFTKTVGSRGAARKVCHAIAQQRVGMLDPSGWALEQNKTAEREGRKKPWVHVMLPMRYEPERAMEDVGYGGDWRTEEGQLLFPKVHTAEIVDEAERNTGSIANVQTQYQHNPQKIQGELFSVDNIQKINDTDVPECDIWVRMWDKAATSESKSGKKKTKPCNTAGVLLGAKKLPHNAMRYVIRDSVADKWEPHIVEDKITHHAEVDITFVPKSKYIIGVEREGGSGGKFSANETVRRNRDFKVEEERPSENKIKRANPLIVAIGFREVYIVQAGFTKKLLDELEDVSKYGEDATLMDQFDALAHAVNLANRLLGKGQKAILSKSNSVAKTRLCMASECKRPAAEDSDYCCKSCEINASWQDGTVCKEHDNHCAERNFQHEQRSG